MTDSFLIRLIISMALVIIGLIWYVLDLRSERDLIKTQLEYWKQIYIELFNQNFKR